MSDEKLEIEKPELTEEEKKEIEDKIQELIDSVDFEELETYGRWNRELEKEEEYQEPLVHQFFHWKQFPFCDCIEIKDEEGKVIEVKHLPWNKKTIIKFLKESLDVEKAQAFVDTVVLYKHNKKKSELEDRLRPLIVSNTYYIEAFGDEHFPDSHKSHVAKWDKDDLEDFESKILKLELAKSYIDSKKPIKDRQLEYSKIDGLLLEALVEKLEEGRPEKMDKYLELRKDIKHRHPIKED